MSQIIQTTVDNPLHAIGADILIIEDQQIVLLGLTTLLSTCKGIKRVDKATKAANALEMVKQHAYAILIIDIELPDMSGFDLLEKIRKFRPDVAVIFHSMHEEFWIIKQMMNSGANAIVLKSDDVGELHNAVGYVLAGESYYSSKFQKYCTEYESKQTLSEREQEVLRAIAQGKKTAEIAEMLFVSTNTIEFHRKHILHKLGATNMAELIKKAIEQGYIAM